MDIYFHFSQINEFLCYLNVSHLSKIAFIAPASPKFSRFQTLRTVFSKVRNNLVNLQDTDKVSNFKQ